MAVLPLMVQWFRVFEAAAPPHDDAWLIFSVQPLKAPWHDPPPVLAELPISVQLVSSELKAPPPRNTAELLMIVQPSNRELYVPPPLDEQLFPDRIQLLKLPE